MTARPFDPTRPDIGPSRRAWRLDHLRDMPAGLLALADVGTAVREGSTLAPVVEALGRASETEFEAIRYLAVDALEEIRHAVLGRCRAYLAGPGPDAGDATVAEHVARLVNAVPARASASVDRLYRSPADPANALRAVEDCGTLAESWRVVERMAVATRDGRLRTLARSLRNAGAEPLGRLEALREGMGPSYAATSALIPARKDLDRGAVVAAYGTLSPHEVGWVWPTTIDAVVATLRGGYRGDVGKDTFAPGNWPLADDVGRSMAAFADVARVYEEAFHRPGFVGMLRRAATVTEIVAEGPDTAGVRILPLMQAVDGPAPGRPRKLAFMPVTGRDDVLVARAQGAVFLLYTKDERTYGQSACLVVLPLADLGEAVPEITEFGLDARDTFRGRARGANFESAEEASQALTDAAFSQGLVPGLLVSEVEIPEAHAPAPSPF